MKSASVRISAIVFAWVVTLVAAYFIGTSSGTDADSVSPVASEPKADKSYYRGETYASEGESSQAQSGGQDEVWPVEGTPGGQSFGQLLDAYLLNPNDPLARESLRLKIANLSAEEIAPTLAQIESLDPSQARDLMLLGVVERWAAYEPQAALAYAQAIPGMRLSNRAVNQALEGWGKSDPAAAIAWWNSPENYAAQRVRQNRLESILEGYVATDPFSAFQFAVGLGEGTLEEQRTKREALRTVVETMVESGNLDSALLWATDMEPGEGQTAALAEIMQEWAEYDPDGASAYLEQLAGRDDFDEVRNSMIRTWAESDPEQASAYLTTLDVDDPNRGRLSAMLVYQWSRYDLTGPAEWLNTQPASPELDRAVATLTYRAASDDPASAMSWAESISDERMRQRSIDRVAREWAGQDPEAFADYVKSSEFSDEEKQRLLETQPNTGGGWGGRYWGR